MYKNKFTPFSIEATIEATFKPIYIKWLEGTREKRIETNEPQVIFGYAD